MALNPNSSTPVIPGGTLEGVDLSTLGPGHRLRDARKAKNLDQADVASSLNLTLTVVNSLERDEYQDMPPQVFVRGYIRSYALMVGLDPEEVVTMYDALVGADQKPDPFRPTTVAARTPQSFENGRLLVWGVGLLLLAGIVWWLLQSGVLDSVFDTVTDTTESAAPAAPEAAPAELVSRVRPLGEPRNEQPAPTEAAVQPEPPTAPVSAGADASTQPARAAGEIPVLEMASAAVMAEVSEPARGLVEAVSGPAPEVSNAVATIKPLAAPVLPEPVASAAQPVESAAEALLVPEPPVVESEVVSPPSLAVAKPGAAAPVAPAISADRGVLRLTFSDNCWTDVADADGKRLAYGVMKKGMVRNLEGRTPFKVTLGQADAVQVKYNGEPFDHQQFSKGKIARFSVGLAAE